MTDLPLAFTCPFCNHGSTHIVAGLVRDIGMGWVVMRMRCDAPSCDRIWHVKMTLVGVNSIRGDDSVIDDEGERACLDAGGFNCPQCRRSNVDMPAGVARINVADQNSPTTSVSLWRVCSDCHKNFDAVYQISQVMTDWVLPSPFRRRPTWPPLPLVEPAGSPLT